MESSGKLFLLDTQVALWIMLDDPKINKKNFIARFCSNNSRIIFHQISTWEIQIKYQLGKLPLPERPEAFLNKAINESGFSYEQIQDEGIFFLDRLPMIHRDPFDRLLISHCIINGYTMISADDVMQSYPVLLEQV